MVQLAEWQEKFEQLGVRVAAMTYDDRAILAAFHAEHSLRYPLLQDEGLKHVDAYGIRNEAYSEGHSGYGIPHPGVLFVNPQGVVLAKFAESGYRERPPMEDIYAALAASIAGAD